MPTIGRGYDDLGIDLLVARLTAFSTREALISPGVAFTAERDRITPWAHDSLLKPLVVIEEATDAPESKGSSRVQGNFTASLRALCIVPHRGDPDLAPARLAYLKEQVRAAIWAGTDLDSVLPSAYALGRPTWTQDNPSPEERKQEDTFDIGYWTFDLTYPWTPETVAGTALDELHVTATHWAAVYTFS